MSSEDQLGALRVVATPLKEQNDLAHQQRVKGALQLVHKKDPAGLERVQDKTDQTREALGTSGLVLDEIKKDEIAAYVLMGCGDAD